MLESTKFTRRCSFANLLYVSFESQKMQFIIFLVVSCEAFAFIYHHHHHHRTSCAQLLLVEATVDAQSVVEVKDAGVKGKGAFASIDLMEGTYIGRYVGDLLTNEGVKTRYPDPTQASYLFELTEELCIDAQESTHFSRFFNHAEHGNLEVRANVESRTIDFFALRDISAGEELTFDYGPKYWIFRGQPTGDSRNFSDPIYRERPPELSIRYPPPVGTRLPLMPLTIAELKAALALPTDEARTALLRCLEFFGATRTAAGGLRARIGVGPDAEERVLDSGAQADVLELQRVALACLTQAVDASGAAQRDVGEWMDSMEAELQLIRRWRDRVPRLASTRHDAASIAAFLLWKNPNGHGVTQPLSREECNDLVYRLETSEDSLAEVLDALGQHAPRAHVTELVDTLAEWVRLGDGCVVTSDEGVPTLVGHVPPLLDAVWRRVPRLMQARILVYHYNPNST